ncbi:MAG: rhodanese-like domain-containing protein [Desulfomicrobiaceae bacterium]
MRSSSRTALSILAIVAAATLLALCFNQWRPTPLAWVRTEAFVPAPAPVPAQPSIHEAPSTPAPEGAAPPAAEVPTPTPAEDQTPPHAEPTPAMESPAPMTESAPQTEPAEKPTTPEAPVADASPQPQEATQTAPAEVPATQEAASAQPEAPAAALSVADALQLHLSGQAVFLDARDPDTYAQGHIPGALCVPPTELDRLWPHIAPHIEGKTVVTYCDGERCPLSEELAAALRARGVSTVLVFVNGWSLWQGEHLPTTTGLNP